MWGSIAMVPLVDMIKRPQHALGLRPPPARLPPHRDAPHPARHASPRLRVAREQRPPLDLDFAIEAPHSVEAVLLSTADNAALTRGLEGAAAQRKPSAAE